MNRALETRLRKLEAARKPDDGVFFLIWGRDEVQLELGLSNAVAIGTISTGDTVVRALWAGHKGMPVSRWIGRRNLTGRGRSTGRRDAAPVGHDGQRIGNNRTDDAVAGHATC